MDVAETVKEHHPTTTTFRPGYAQIYISNSSRYFSKKTLYEHSDGFHEKGLQLDSQANLIVQFDFGITDKESGEFWMCDMKHDESLAQLFIDGLFRIVPTVCQPYSQSAMIILKKFGCDNKQLSPYLSCVAFILPVITKRPMTFGLEIALYMEQKVLHRVSFNVKSHDYGIDLSDIQSGYFLPSVETPLCKKRMTGEFAKNSSQKLLYHFQRLGDNGELVKFAEDQEKVINDMGEEKSWVDIRLAVELQRAITMYGQGWMDECLTICQSVCDEAKKCCIENLPFILGKAFYIMSGVYRQRNEFELAKQFMDWSTENFMQVSECAETGNNRYNQAALYAQKAAHCGLTSEEHKQAVDGFEDAIRMYSTHEVFEPKKNRNIIRTSNRQISFLLKVSRSKSPEINVDVSEEDVVKASKVVERVNKLLPQCPKRHKVTFLISKADFFIRKALSKAFFNDEEQGRKHLQKAMTILKDAKLLSTKLGMRKETEGVNEREKLIEYLLQSGLRQYLQEMHQSEPVISLHDTDMTNEACDIEALILSVQLENIWQSEQCTEDPDS